MLKGYFDESYSNGVFVLAGYVAKEESWNNFSTDWNDLLLSLSLDEFHMNVMSNRPDQCEQFYRIIEKHIDAGFAAIVKRSDAIESMQQVPYPDWISRKKENIAKFEIYAAFSMIERILSENQEKLYPIALPVDPIFDEHSLSRQHIKGRRLMQYLYADNPSVPLFGLPPAFKTSHATMPLQAADMLAWWLRRTIIDGKLGIGYPWAPKKEMNFVAAMSSVEEFIKIRKIGINVQEEVRAGMDMKLAYRTVHARYTAKT